MAYVIEYVCRQLLKVQKTTFLGGFPAHIPYNPSDNGQLGVSLAFPPPTFFGTVLWALRV
jgi:hypothetical protein